MVSILVTGAAGAIGKRVVSRLIDNPAVARVVALDRQNQEFVGIHSGSPDLAFHQVDLNYDELEPLFSGCDSVIHLAEDRKHRDNLQMAQSGLGRVLKATASAGCRHVVLLSSGLIYGARSDNPVPITEAQPLRPNSELAHVRIKAQLEQDATSWAASTESTLAVLRPTAALSETDSSWIGSALRAAVAIRPDQVDPPVQFLHQDDLADAIVLASLSRLDSVFNVAPDSWIEAEVFRALRGEAEIRLPSLLGEVRLRAAKAMANRKLLDGLEPYVRHPWVISNDRLKSEGWQPMFTNEEAYVAGSASPLLSSIGPQRRQELALGLAGTTGVAVIGGALWLARRSAR